MKLELDLNPDVSQLTSFLQVSNHDRKFILVVNVMVWKARTRTLRVERMPSGGFYRNVNVVC